MTTPETIAITIAMFPLAALATMMLGIYLLARLDRYDSGGINIPIRLTLAIPTATAVIVLAFVWGWL